MKTESVVILVYCLFVSRALSMPKDSLGIYSIPSKIIEDDAEFLEEHGRFMLANMNLTIDPCENFFEYACGNWQNDTMVPLLARNGTFMEDMEVQANELILEFLKNQTFLSENTAEAKAKKFFTSCLNNKEDFSQFYRRIYKSLKEPIAKDGEALNWMLLNFYSEYGLTPLLPFYIRYNESSSTFEIFIDNFVPKLTSRSFNLTKFSEDLKFEDKDDVKMELEELRKFEKKLIASVTRSNTSESQSLGDFLETHNTTADVDWKRFFDLAFNGTQENSWIINDNVGDFTKLKKFLREADASVMFRYVKWIHILTFYEHNWYWANMEDVERGCQSFTVYYFKSAIIPWFIETAFSEESRADALLLSKRLRDTFYSMIDQTTWLDSETKSGAKTKLRAMDIYFGYTDEMKDRSKIDETFKEVNITKNFWESLTNLDKKVARDRLRKVGQAEIDSQLSTYESNAQYTPDLNQAFMTISLSQLPLYHIKLPNSLKFGGIGSVIGHEMAHGFDTQCYKYDYDGKKRNWWSAESLRNFKERYQCLESQYNKFIFNGLKTNGKQTSGDNIADNVGLQIAYRAYLRLLDEDGLVENGEGKPLPNVAFTNKQLFFLKYAQSFCDGQSLNAKMDQILKDEHSVNEFRVIGPLINMPEFSEGFNCALGTNMNPLKKCIIYGNE